MTSATPDLAPRHSPRLVEIDSLRGLAALWVVVFHLSFGVRWRWLPDEPELVSRIAPFEFNLEGLLAVDLFFVISGFVIYMTLARSADVASFALSRFARLYPAYWACLAITVVAALSFPLARQPISLTAVLANATMAQAFLGVPAIEDVYWSLSYELAFYALMSGLLALRLLGRVEAIGAAWLLLSLVLLKIFPALGHAIPWRVQTALALPYAPLFFAGILFYRLRSIGVTRFRLGLLAACLATRVYHEPDFVIVASCLIFAVFALAAWQRLPLLRWPPLIWLGGVSFPLYLVHQSVGFRLQAYAVGHGWNAWIAAAAAMTLVILLAWVVSVTVERPAQRNIRRRFTTAPRPR